MTTNASQPRPDSISSDQTGDSARSDEILALGRKLVNELGLEPSVDTLGRWMAHYIAELIVNTESTTGKEKDLAEKNCFEAILALWKHRAELPNGKRPFEELEPIVRAIESLDPDNDTPRYFRSTLAPKGEVEEQSEADAWLATADALDYSARILIGYCLSEAALAAVDKSKEWVKLAEAAEVAGGAPEIVIHFISNNADLGKDPAPNAEVRERLQDRIRRLEAFIKAADSVERNLRARLEVLPPLAEADDIDAENPRQPNPIDRDDT